MVLLAFLISGYLGVLFILLDLLILILLLSSWHRIILYLVNAKKIIPSYGVKMLMQNQAALAGEKSITVFTSSRFPNDIFIVSDKKTYYVVVGNSHYNDTGLSWMLVKISQFFGERFDKVMREYSLVSLSVLMIVGPAEMFVQKIKRLSPTLGKNIESLLVLLFAWTPSISNVFSLNLSQVRGSAKKHTEMVVEKMPTHGNVVSGVLRKLSLSYQSLFQ